MEKIFLETVHLCGSTETSEYEEFAVSTFNILLGDCFNENNHLRENNGKEKLKIVPRIETLADELPYEEQLRAVLPYGWAAKLLIVSGDMDEGMHTIYQQMFANNVNRLCNKAIEESVVDVYAEH